jgi:hypothetical protein
MRLALMLTACCVLALRFDAAAQVPIDSQKIILTYPDNGETFHVGDTITVQWICIDSDNIIAVDIRMSPDNGKTWILLNGTSIKYYDATSWYHYKWVIPDSIKENSPGTTEFELAGTHSCLIRVENYSPQDQTEISVSSKPIIILARSGAVLPFRPVDRKPTFSVRDALSPQTSALWGNTSVRFFDTRGRAISTGKGSAAGLFIGVIPGETHAVRETGKSMYLR